MVSVFSLLVGLEAILRINTALNGLSPVLPWCSQVIMGTASSRYRDGAKKVFGVKAMSELDGIPSVGPLPAAVERHFNLEST